MTVEFNNNYNLRRLGDIKSALKKVEAGIDAEVLKLDIQVAVTKEPVPFADRDQLVYRSLSVGESWGQLFDCGWFRLTGTLADRSILENDLYLKFDVNGEGLLFDDEGNALKGFTNGSSVFDRNHGEPGKAYYRMNDLIDGNGGIELYLDCGANDLFGSLQDNGIIRYASVVRRDMARESLYYDLETLIAIQETEESLADTLVEELYELAAKINYEEGDVYAAAEDLVKKYLSEKAESDFTFYAVGHAHIDLAWLWPIRETKRKAARTLTNVFHLIEKYRDFVFGISQPQMLEWLREDYPDVFGRIKTYVEQGRIEVQGGMWVEADTNVSGEEALVRQMLYGKKYWQENFGKDVQSLWLPDVFGYSAAMPQIIAGSDMAYFMTIKLSWSLVNVFPYHTFNWSGLDGSQVLVHMPPEGNYNSSATRKAVKGSYENYREKEVSSEALLLYGIGDGGGGPGEEHIERIERNNRSVNAKAIKLDSSESFFDLLNDRRDKYPSWQGELYLENHQGTYTSQAEIKKNNRFLENKLKMVEALLVSLDNSEYEDRIEKIWKEVLLYQFHDILPGSSIKRVYEEALVRYSELSQQLDVIIENVTQSRLSNTYDEGKYIFNPHSAAATFYNLWDGRLYKTEVAPLSTSIIKEEVYDGKAADFEGAIETDSLRVTFGSNGEIGSIRDLDSDREVLTGPGNQLKIYKDHGNAWDIRDDYRMQTPDKWHIKSRDYTQYGSIHVLVQHYEYRESTLIEQVMIDAAERSVEFSHELDWREMGHMMRSEFPFAVNSDEATFDIQFGHFNRSRRNETSIQKAQFEVCGHNWVDVSEKGLGCALINDCKYGYYVKDGVVDINLIRSTDYPAKDGDIGKTSYRYKLMVHDGDFVKAGVDHVGQVFNTVYPIFESSLVLDEPIFELAEGVAYSTIKHSYDKGGIVLRIYERNGEQVTTSVRTRLQYTEVYEVNMLEERVNKLVNLERVELKPFEVMTLRFDL